jgi:hypothetical protein
MILHNIRKDNKRLVIYIDENPESPREWENRGIMVCWHRNYDLGDEQPKMKSNDWAISLADLDDGTDMDKVWKVLHNKYVILPLYLYDHSGITISTAPFHCPWDSGQVGWIYCERGKEGKSDEDLTKYLEGEVEIYDQYLRGDVYGFECFTITKCECCGHESEEFEDSCWGFYGSNFEEMKGNIPKEFHELLGEI